MKKALDIRSRAAAALIIARSEQRKREAEKVEAEWAEREAKLLAELRKILGPDLTGAQWQRLPDVGHIIAEADGFYWWLGTLPGHVGHRVVVACKVPAPTIPPHGGDGCFAVAFLPVDAMLALGLFLESIEKGALQWNMTRGRHECLVWAGSLSQLITEVAMQAAKCG